MKRSFLIYIIPALLLVCFSHVVYCLVVGSDEEVSRERFTAFSSSDNDNMVLGFAAMEEGFLLEDSLTAMTFDSHFNVSGDIVLNGGSLFLNQDLVLRSMATMTSLGNVYGSGHVLEFSHTTSHFGESIDTVFCFDSVMFVLNSNAYLNNTICFEGAYTIGGRGHVLDLDALGNIIVGSNSGLHITNITLKGIEGSNIAGKDSSSLLTLENVRWKQVGDYSFDQGSLQLCDMVSMYGGHTFSYQSGSPCSIEEDSIWSLYNGFTLRYDPQESQAQDLFCFKDRSSTLQMHGATLSVSDVGLHFKKGALHIEQDSVLTVDDAAITIGTGDSEQDFSCFLQKV